MKYIITVVHEVMADNEREAFKRLSRYMADIVYIRVQDMSKTPEVKLTSVNCEVKNEA